MAEIQPNFEYQKIPETKQITLDMASSSIASEFHPDRNEDDSFFDTKRNSFGVFDGMGGETDGQKASATCTEVVKKHLANIPKRSNRAAVKKILQESYDEANNRLLKMGELAGGVVGSTAVYGFTYQNELGNQEIAIANAGDSRAYLFRDGTLTKITQDHGYARANFGSKSSAMDTVLDDVKDPSTLSWEYLNLYKNRNVIYNHVGLADGGVDVFFQTLTPGDILLFSSDGIHDNLTTTEILSTISQLRGEPSSTITQELVQKSIIRSREKSPRSKINDTATTRSKKDDMTALVIKVNGTQKKSESIPTTEDKSVYAPKVGDIVNVQRSSGVIQPGWEIYHINQQEGYVMVRAKTENSDQFLFKKIEFGLNERLNGPAKPEHISQSQDLFQLFHTLKGLGGVQGSSEFFPSDYLINTIRLIKSGQKTIESITRSNGLRETVKKLLNK